MPRQTRILVIDDEPDGIRSRIALIDQPLQAGVRVKYPNDVRSKDIEDAQLVLVDYRLDHWQENTRAAEICRQVPNGIALAAILQQQLIKLDHPIAFAIHSDHLKELTDPFPPEPRVHMIARTYNLDWAFVKSPKGGGSS